MKVFRKDCRITGHDPKLIARLARRLEKVASELDELDLEIFGAEGAALYIVARRHSNKLQVHGEPHVLAHIEEGGNGGIMQCVEMKDGSHSLCG